jgi:hypothetical protein
MFLRVVPGLLQEDSGARSILADLTLGHYHSFSATHEYPVMILSVVLFMSVGGSNDIATRLKGRDQCPKTFVVSFDLRNSLIFGEKKLQEFA